MTETKYISVEKLHIDPANVRPEPIVDEKLRDNIRDKGILEPLVVRPQDGKYRVVVGGRRFVAAKNIGLDEPPCVIREDLKGDDETAELQSFVENECREDIPKWKKKKIVEKEYKKTDGRNSKSKRVKKVMNKLNVSEETVYGYVDFEKLDLTLNIRQKEPSERTDEEIELLESSLSENHLLASGEAEDLDRDEYRREKAKGFPALKKIPTKVGKNLYRSDFFLDLQKEDLAKAHELATKAVKVGQKRAPNIIKKWKKRIKGTKKKGKTIVRPKISQRFFSN